MDRYQETTNLTLTSIAAVEFRPGIDMVRRRSPAWGVPCALRARRQGQERYVTGTYGQPQMPSDLRRNGQRGMTIQFPG